MRSLPRFAVLVVVVSSLGLGVFGCKKASTTPIADQPATPTSAPAPGPATPDVKPTSGSTPAVTKLIDPGTGPRTKLRYHVAAGLKETMVMKMHQKMTMAGRTVDVPMYTMTMSSVVQSAANGRFVQAFNLDSIDIDEGSDPAMAKRLRDAMAPLVGLKGTSERSDRGEALGATIVPPPGLPPQMAQLLEGMKQSLGGLSLPLPEEAIGVGARWDVSSIITLQGMTFEQITHAVLTKVDGDTISITATLEQIARPQHVDNGHGTVFDLTRYGGTGTVQMTFRLDRVVPEVGKANMKTEITISMAGTEQTTGTEIETDITPGK